MRRRPLYLGWEDEEEMGRGAPLLVRRTREGGGIDPRRELMPAAPSTQASPAVRRESSNPSTGAGTQIRVAILYKPRLTRRPRGHRPSSSDRNPKSPPTRTSAATRPISDHWSPSTPRLDGVGRRGIQGHQPIGATRPDAARAPAPSWSPRAGQEVGRDERLMEAFIVGDGAEHTGRLVSRPSTSTSVRRGRSSLRPRRRGLPGGA